MTTFGGGQLFFELGVGTVLVGRDGQLVAVVFEESSEAELATDAAEELSRREDDGLGSRRRDAARVLVDPGYVIAGYLGG